jgi:hypothetical protein
MTKSDLQFYLIFGAYPIQRNFYGVWLGFSTNTHIVPEESRLTCNQAVLSAIVKDNLGFQ